MKRLRFAALIIAAMMIISGCNTHISDTEPETTAASETAETVSAPETAETTETADDTQYTIPDEELSGMNTSEDPLPDDGNGEAIFERLKADSYFGNENAEASALLDRGSFAKDIVKYSGFAQRQHYYICHLIEYILDFLHQKILHSDICWELRSFSVVQQMHPYIFSEVP